MNFGMTRREVKYHRIEVVAVAVARKNKQIFVQIQFWDRPAYIVKQKQNMIQFNHEPTVMDVRNFHNVSFRDQYQTIT
jgi:hypothetical protein